LSGRFLKSEPNSTRPWRVSPRCIDDSLGMLHDAVLA
jgi:hypothetical protein